MRKQHGWNKEEKYSHTFSKRECGHCEETCWYENIIKDKMKDKDALAEKEPVDAKKTWKLRKVKVISKWSL